MSRSRNTSTQIAVNRRPWADPQEVADLIFRAVHDPAPGLRYLAGEDAKLIATAYGRLDFETYEAQIRQTLDWKD